MENKRPLVVVAVIALLLIIAAVVFFTIRSQKDDTTAATPAPAPQSETAETPAPAAEPDKTTSIRIPTFDVLRVEPDGTAVIAGSAEPDGKLEVKEGDKVITASDVDKSGDFVAIIDKPLPPGNHEIYLNVSMPDGRNARSKQTATIAIPEGDDKKDLLAVITEPDKPTQVVEAPAPTEPAKLAAAAPETANGDTRLNPVNVEGKTAKEPAATSPAKPAIDASVRISAVEIEGSTLYIAGNGTANAAVRGYVDNNFAAQDEVNAKGSFVIQATIDIPVGRHQIRVDMLDKDGNVIARASVSFDRPEGNQVSAVAKAPANDTTTDASGTQTFVQPELQASDNAVIIRKGDNLWTISRRVYGRGVRYTTIYLANEPQIADPNLILPGQVFSVPNQPLPIGEAEELHRRLEKGLPVGPEYKLPEKTGN
ncbi:LysM peptidoglycan-binding domain-containing protein [Martelella alba]|uniref:LysM peptidoglycan-binding domain-containing protein n=1 Tax=Martelella alba TaxID=2590451 RepID=A0A506UJD7_9HYPH|nr:LysM peptidoglycan-binding domain-containing protein [Martelella alba]TPW33426.1 LysM peptidoglycan-binding domain-containing protein [Martelella alba]